MRANLAKREPGFLEFWKERDISGKMLKNREGAPSFVLHDGPPTQTDIFISERRSTRSSRTSSPNIKP